MSQPFTIILPIVAVILALGLVAALWYWWSGGQSEEGSSPDSQPDVFPANLPDGNNQTETTLGGLRQRLSSLTSSLGSYIQSRPQGTLRDSDMIEVLRLHRDLSNGALVIEIDGHRYYALDEIADLQIRRRFLGNAEAMAQFAQLKKGTSPLIDWSTPVPTPLPATSNEVVSPLVDPLLMSASVPAETGSKKKGKEPPKPKSMGEEIEELLQYRLTLTPEMAHRSIHIRSAADGSIYVEVDNQTFDGIGSVTDLEVRSFLQKLIREWEARK